MPIKLIPPRKGFSPYYYGRGTYLGVFVNKSTKTDRPPLAKRVIKQWENEIERGRFATDKGPTFLSAAVSYMQAGGERTYVAWLMEKVYECSGSVAFNCVFKFQFAAATRTIAHEWFF